MNIDFGVLLPIIGLLIAIVNIFVEVIKKVTWDKVPTNVVTLIVAIALTVVAYIAYAQITGTAIVWYMIVGAIITGVLVCYGAMFGYDKLKETLGSYSDLKTLKESKTNTDNK